MTQIEYMIKQLERINAERAMAVKALQEIEGYLGGESYPAVSEALTLAYMTAYGTLCELGEDE